MVLFSLFNLYAYGLAPYEPVSHGGSKTFYQGGPLGIRALLMALNPMEIARGLVLAVRYLITSTPTQDYNSMPLQQGVNADLSPAYSPHVRYDTHSGIEPAHSLNGAEYGHVERYTPF